MTVIPVECPYCGERDVVSNGRNKRGVRRYRCRNNDCTHNYFLLDYAYNGSKPGIDEKIINMTANASGIRDIARVLEISTDKVMAILKKQRNL